LIVTVECVVSVLHGVLVYVQVSWTQYMNALLGAGGVTFSPVHEDTEVVVLHEEALEDVCRIVAEYSANSTLQTYVRSPTIH